MTSGKVSELPRSAWRSIVLWTAIPTALAVLASDVISIFLLGLLDHGINPAGLLAATVLPIVLGGPMMFYQSLRHQQLKLANTRLDILASTDWLTECLNRRAFTHRTSDMLEQHPGRAASLLVVDVDHFKAINDAFGHEAGDIALQLIALSIRETVGNADIVGRMGGEEFGVFMPHADLDAALIAAERILDAVARIRFAPSDVPHPLSVSVGGATATDPASFADLFRVADQQLYGAKAAGRNRLSLVRYAPAEAAENLRRFGQRERLTARTA